MVRILLLFLAISCNNIVNAQKYPRGLPDEPDTLYGQTLQKAPLTNGLYRDVQPSYSLKRYTPDPGWQEHGTCAAFATAFSARTIIEAQNNGWPSKATISDNAFSPGFIYRITNANNSRCWGAYTTQLLDNMARYGVPKKKDYPYECPGT